MKTYTAEELTSMLVSRKTPPQPVTIIREAFIIDAKPEEDPNVFEEITTPFYVRVVSIPERLKIQTALDAARQQGKSEGTCLALVVRLCACDVNGTRLFNDNWSGNGEADENILAIFNCGLIANGFRRTRAIVKRKTTGELETESVSTETPVETIGKN